MNPMRLIAEKESGELLLSGRGLGWIFALTVVLSIFGLLLVSNTELSLLDNAQVVYMMMGTVTALGSLLAIVIGSDAIAGERERGSLIPLLLTPITPNDLLLGKMGGLIVSWCVMYVLALPYLWAIGSSGQNLFESIVYLAMFGTPVVLIFGFFTLGLSARLKTVRSTLVTGLIVLMLSASPLLLGPSLRQTAIGRGFDAINPFSAAVNSFDSVVIDSQPLSLQMVRLGIVLAWLVLAAVFARRCLRNVTL